MKFTGLCGRSWSAHRAYVDGFGTLSGPLRAVFGILDALGVLSWLCGRSWDAIGASVGCYWPERSSGTDREAILGGDHTEKLAEPRRGSVHGPDAETPYTSLKYIALTPPIRFASQFFCARAVLTAYVWTGSHAVSTVKGNAVRAVSACC